MICVRHSVAHGPAKDQRANNCANHAHQGHLACLRMWHAICDCAADQRPKGPGEDRRVRVRPVCAPAWPGPGDNSNHCPNHRPNYVTHGALHYAMIFHPASITIDRRLPHEDDIPSIPRQQGKRKIGLDHFFLAQSPCICYGWSINDDVTGRPDTVPPPPRGGPGSLERPMRHDQRRRRTSQAEHTYALGLASMLRTALSIHRITASNQFIPPPPGQGLSNTFERTSFAMLSHAAVLYFQVVFCFALYARKTKYRHKLKCH
jgi:hypothetical protein